MWTPPLVHAFIKQTKDLRHIKTPSQCLSKTPKSKPQNEPSHTYHDPLYYKTVAAVVAKTTAAVNSHEPDKADAAAMK